MNPKNVRTMAAAAVVIVICLLFSWVQYGDVSQDGDVPEDSLEGTWHPVYSYNSGLDVVINVPDSLDVTVEGESVMLGTDGQYLEFRMVSDREAVSVNDGRDYQLYLEDGTLYLITIHRTSDVHGIVYVAMSRDATATLPSDVVDLEGSQYDMVLRMTNGYEFREMEIAADVTVDSHAFHIVRVTVAMESGSVGAIGFVKSDGSRTVITGAIVEGSDSYGQFNMVIDGDGVMLSMSTRYAYAGGTDGVATDLGNGDLALPDGTIMDVVVEAGMAAIGDDSGYAPGMVCWTMGDDYITSGKTVIVWDGSSYTVLAGLAVA